MKFYYYFPQTVSRDVVADFLAARFDAPAAANELRRGPDDGPGVMYAQAPADGARDVYRPDQQAWRRVGPVWIGWYHDAQPGPADLARPESFTAYPARLGDGREWRIPVARTFPAGCPLPDCLVMDEDGHVSRETLAAYAHLSRHADRVWSIVCRDNAIDSGDTTPVEPMSDREAFEICTDILAAAYRVGPEEIALLGLLTTTGRQLIYAYFVDLPAYLDQVAGDPAAKKNDRACDDAPPPATSPES
jgi:hypothetical protein